MPVNLPRLTALLLCTFCVAASTASDSAASADTARPMSERLLQAAEALKPGLVIVEYHLRYDKGQPPEGIAGGYEPVRRGTMRWRDRSEDLVREKRPLEVEGFLVSPDTVVTNDLGIHERFIEAITVRAGNSVVGAVPGAYAQSQDALLLDLQAPLSGSTPLVFGEGSPWATVRYARRDAGWAVEMGPAPGGVVLTDDGPVSDIEPGALVIDSTGTALGMAMNHELALDSSWRGSPLAWEAVPAAQRNRLVSDLQRVASEALVHVKLSLRSPKKTGMERYGDWGGARYRGDNVSATEADAVGVCLDGYRVLVLAELAAEATARLERIQVFTGDGAPRTATFVGTLADFGALMVKLDKPVKAFVAPAAEPLASYKNRLLLKARISMAGKQRIAFFWHGRIRGFEKGYMGEPYPRLGFEDKDIFFFTPEGALLALPLGQRRKGGNSPEDSWQYSNIPTAPVSLLQPVLSQPEAHFDTSNVPLGEEQEGRVAWLGVVLQAMDRELARANGVAEQTNDGTSGTLVSYVYEGSPAAKAGIEAGMILLRVQPKGHPRPLNIKLEGSDWHEPFPWDRLDELPEEFFDRLPPPWPTARNAFSRMLTEIGFGTSITVDVVDKGKAFTRTFTVEESPPHFGSAAKVRDERLGVTVRDMTFEVRQYFQKDRGDPGVIVSRVQPGSKASVAGIRPYELITHVNGRKITSARDFEKLARNGKEVRLSVERMGMTRQARIKVEG